MTHVQIIKKFDRMLLSYKGTAEPKRSSLRAFRGYWMIPGESYEFRLVAVEPRNTWAIQVKHPNKAIQPSLLEAEMGITFIQSIIHDKFEDVYPVFRWDVFPTQLHKRIYRRSEFLLMFNLYKINGEKGSKI